MLQFKSYNIDDVKKIKEFLYIPDKIGSDYSIEVIYSWRNLLNTQIAYSSDDAFIKSMYDENNHCFFLPLKHGIENIEVLQEYFLNSEEKFTFEMCNLSKEEANKLNLKFPHSRIFNNRKWSDYIYSVDDLANFKGNKYASKRHHANRFLKLYPDSYIVEATPSDKKEILSFLDEFEKQKEFNSSEARFEEEMTRTLVLNYEKLGLKCFLLKNNEKVIGLNILEFKKDVIYDHVEKCLREYEGVYAYLVREIARKFEGKYKFINREDDSGDLNLRYSKESYHPLYLLDKYLLIVENNLDLLTKIPDLVVNKSISIGELKENFKDDYAKLNLDDERNKFWGYDYRNDLKNGEKADSDYFYNIVKSDFSNKTSFVFCLYYEGKLSGEIVAYNLKNDNSCEIGYRLFKEFEGKNIAYLSLLKVLDYLKNNVKLNYFSIKSYKENKKSLSLIERLNAQYLNSDEAFKYFKVS